MLRNLKIRNLAVIHDVTVSLNDGLTVLSGETGAGKSILIDALGLLLGDRADNQAIRAGAERAELAASFELARDSAAMDWLCERDLQDPDDPETLHLRRTLPREGQSKATINGSPVPVRQLRELGACLVEIHGQHEHQSLTLSARQRDILDGYGGHAAQRDELAGHCQRLAEIDQQIAELDALGDDGAQRSEFLRYQLQELEELAPAAGEFSELELEFRRLSRYDAVLADATAAVDGLYEADTNAHAQIAAALLRLQNAAACDPAFAEAAELCQQAEIAAQEAALAAQGALDRQDSDPERLAWLSQRLDTYQNLARKHRVAPGDLAEHADALTRELERLEHADAHLDRLRAQYQSALDDYRQAAATLSTLRQASAERLSQMVSDTLQPLGLPHARFQVSVKAQPERPPAALGSDEIGFLVTMNPGQPPAALAKVASGGELSRTSLALQVVCIDQSPVPVLLFDEVDAGIGGAVAEVVGRRLRDLGAHYQVLCVTHQPQVAAQAHAHLRVSKKVTTGQTFTVIETLDPDQRVAELARMLGGLEITEQTAAHAREMLALASV